MGYSILDPTNRYNFRLATEEEQRMGSSLFIIDNTKKMNILIDHHEDAGCSYHRVWIPAVQIATMSDVTVTRRNGTLRFNNDILLFNRTPLGPISDIPVLKHNGTKVVVDIDDNWILYPHHEMAADWAKSRAHEQIQECLKLADMVLTSNERLKAAAGHLNSNINVVPNGLLFGEGQFVYNPHNHHKVNFIYTGGSSHVHDLSILKPVMKRLHSDSKFRNEGQVVLAGYQHEYGMGNVHGPWAKMLSTVAASGSYEVLGHRSLYTYMDTYNRADVALAPLEDTTFNMCKSNLKTLEAGCKYIPIIASNMEPYTQDRECPGVILCSTTKEWYEAIKMLLGDRVLRQTLGQQLGDYVREKYPMKKFAQQRIDLFKTL